MNNKNNLLSITNDVAENSILEHARTTSSYSNTLSENFKDHVRNFRPCLDEINFSVLDLKKNFTRLTDPSTPKNYGEPIAIKKEVQKVLDCLCVDGNEKTVYLMSENLRAINKVEIDSDKVASYHAEYMLKIAEPGWPLFSYQKSILNACHSDLEDLRPLSNAIVHQVPNSSLEGFLEVLDLTQCNEFISTICCEHRIVLIVGMVRFFPYMHSLYKPGFFKGLLKDVIYKLNARIKINLSSYLSSRTFVVPSLIGGMFYVGGLCFKGGNFTGVIQDFNHGNGRLFIENVKEYAKHFHFSSIEWADAAALIKNFAGKIGYFTGGLLSAFGKGAAIAAAEDGAEIASSIIKKK